MPTQELSSTVRVDGTEYSNQDIELITDRYNTTAEFRCKLITEQSQFEFEEREDTVEVLLNDNQVFTGTLNDATDKDLLTVEITAFDAVKLLKNETITERFQQAKASSILDTIISKAGVQPNIDIPQQLLTVEFTNTRIDKALESIARLTDAVWFVSRANDLVFTDSPPAFEYFLSNDGQPNSILDASAGKRTPAYQSVKVMGGAPASRNGAINTAHLLASQWITATAGDGQPVFEIRNRDISTQKQANKVATSVYKKLQKQQKGGFVRTVGDSRIRPLDVIEMPERFGNEKYLVSSIKHIMNNDDGFETKIGCGGLIDSSVGGTSTTTDSGARVA